MGAPRASRGSASSGNGPGVVRERSVRARAVVIDARPAVLACPTRVVRRRRRARGAPRALATRGRDAPPVDAASLGGRGRRT